MDFSIEPQLTPEGYARELLYKLKIESIPVDPAEVCKKLGINIFHDYLDAEALLARKNNKAKIILNINSRYESREKFTIAHEIGHYTIPYHTDEIYSCNLKDIYNFKSNKKAELEANEFASELLIPSSFFNSDVDKHTASLQTFINLSEKYGTSLTATAIKFIAKTEDKSAIILSENNKILWSAKSKSFKYQLRTGNLSERSYAYDFFHGGTLPNKADHVYSMAWLTDWDKDYIIEESIAFLGLNMVLTVLTLQYDDEEDKNENDEY